MYYSVHTPTGWVARRTVDSPLTADHSAPFAYQYPDVEDAFAVAREFDGATVVDSTGKAVPACACGSPADWVITELPGETDSHNQGGALGDFVCDTHHLQTEAYGYGVGPLDDGSRIHLDGGTCTDDVCTRTHAR